MGETAEINRLRNECFSLVSRFIDVQEQIQDQSSQSTFFSNPYISRYYGKSLGLMKSNDGEAGGHESYNAALAKV